MKTTKHSRAGFSLVELMIAVAIIAILTMMATPRYQIYAQRSRVNASLAVARPVQLAVAEYAAINAALPADAQALLPYGVAPDGGAHRSGLVAGVRYEGGEAPAIIIQYRDDADVSADLRGKELRLRPDLKDDGSLSFSVADDTSLPTELRPRLR